MEPRTDSNHLWLSRIQDGMERDKPQEEELQRQLKSLSRGERARV